MKKTLLTLSLLTILCACNGGASSAASGESSAVSSEESSAVSSEIEGETDVFNAYHLAEKIAYAASKYGDPVTAKGLMDKVSEDLSSRGSGMEVKATNKDLVLLLHAAFNGITPERVGIRNFQGYKNFSLVALNLEGFTRDTPAYEAIKWLNDLGLFVVGSAFKAATTIDEATAKLWTDRFHVYFGTSAQDDFFGYANHDLLYENCPADSKATSESSVYYSSLISQANINAWAKSYYDKVPAAAAYESTYLDMERRVKGDASGLAAAVKTLTDPTTIGDFIEALKKMAIDTGYCPLWDTTTYGKQSPVIGDTSYNVFCVTTETYSNDSRSKDIAPGQDDYKSSVSRFAPIFADVMGYNDALAKQWATRYTDFKYQFALRREENTALANKYLVPEENKIYGDEKDGLNLYQFLSDLGVNNPKWFLFKDARETQSLLDLFSQDHLLELQGLCVWQMLQHYTACLPNGASVMAWAHTNGARHDEEGLKGDSLYGNLVIPYVAGNLANYYLSTPEFDEDLETIHTLIANLRDAFAQRAENATNTWATVSAKAKVKAKLDKIVSYVGGADDDGNKHEYLDMKFRSKDEGASLYDNLTIFSNTEFDAYTKNLGTEWSIDTRVAQLETMMADYRPLYANAFYAPWVNGIDITLGYMAAYKRPGAMTNEELLGSYGWVVGHEMSHGLDASGIYYDQNGNYKTNGYFLEKDTKAYNAEAKKIAQFYNKDEVMPGHVSNGFLVRDEAIADVTGIGMAVDVAKNIPGFDWEAFFLSAAMNFGAYASQAVFTEYYEPDEHPYGRVRVNQAFKTVKKFYETFDIKEGDGMWVDPDARAVIWPES